MQERHVIVDTKDGKMETFVVHPDGSGPFVGVVMYQNVGGLSEILRGMARRVAQEGYYCAVPDLYYRLGKVVIDPDSKDPSVLAVRAAASASVQDSSRVMEDTRSLLAYMRTDPLVNPGPMGAIGYCMGGRFSPLAAGTFPETFKATTSLFGTPMIEDAPYSPHRIIDRIRGEIYLGFAEDDHSMPLDKVEEWRGLMEKNCKAKWQVEVHPGTKHGYAFPGRLVYHKQASELSWDRTFAMFKRQLLS